MGGVLRHLTSVRGRGHWFVLCAWIHFSLSDRKESSTAGSVSIRSPSNMSRDRGSILSWSSREKGSISKPGTWDRALAISLERTVGDSPAGRRTRYSSDAS